MLIVIAAQFSEGAYANSSPELKRSRTRHRVE
jgi:hypothetical protein